MAGSAFIHVIGNVGGDPETRQAGRSDVCEFNIAVNSRSGQDDVTTWFRAKIWGREGEGLLGVADKYVTKGKQVSVRGDLSTSEWEDRDGNKRTTLEINVRGLDLLGSREDGGGGRSNSRGRDRDDDRGSYRGERDRRDRRDDRDRGRSDRGSSGSSSRGSGRDRDLDDEIPF